MLESIHFPRGGSLTRNRLSLGLKTACADGQMRAVRLVWHASDRHRSD